MGVVVAGDVDRMWQVIMTTAALDLFFLSVLLGHPVSK